MARKSRKVDYVNVGNKENLVTEAENQCEKVSHAALYARLSYESEKNRERNTIETQMVLLHNFVKEQKVALQKKDVDTANGTISVNKTYYRKNGMDMVTTPKTEQSVREIVIPKFLVKELQDYMNRMYGLEDEDRIFPLVAEAIQHKLKAEIEKGGLKKIRVHDLRHSHVAYLIHQGVEPLVIKERLGHKDIQITLNTYGHLYPSKQNAVAELLEQKRSEVKCPKIK